MGSFLGMRLCTKCVITRIPGGEGKKCLHSLPEGLDTTSFDNEHLHGILFSSALLHLGFGARELGSNSSTYQLCNLGKSFGLPKTPLLLLTDGDNNSYFALNGSKEILQEKG